MKLELKHLAPYLPYGLKLFGGIRQVEYEMNFSILEYMINNDTLLIPILRPISDLTKEIEVNGERFIPANIFWIEYGGGCQGVSKNKWKSEFIDNILYSPITTLPFGVIQKLFEWHFDCFDLLSNNLAINYNEIYK